MDGDRDFLLAIGLWMVIVKINWTGLVFVVIDVDGYTLRMILICGWPYLPQPAIGFHVAVDTLKSTQLPEN